MQLVQPNLESFLVVLPPRPLVQPHLLLRVFLRGLVEGLFVYAPRPQQTPFLPPLLLRVALRLLGVAVQVSFGKAKYFNRVSTS